MYASIVGIQRSTTFVKGVSLTPDIQSKGLDFHNELIREAKLKKKEKKKLVMTNTCVVKSTTFYTPFQPCS